jgi:hypothetical protein
MGRLTFVLSLALAACEPPPTRIAPTHDGGVAVDAIPRPDAAPSPDAPRAPALVELSPSIGTYVVLAEDDLVQAAGAFAEHRAAQGYAARVHRVSDLVAAPAAPQALVAAARKLLAGRKRPVHLLLLGDAPGPGEKTSGRIPALPCTNHLGGCWTDNDYADLDADGLPDVAVGRVPARSTREALAYLAKLTAHEGSYQPGAWNRRVSLYTGQGYYGAATDTLIEMAMMEGLKRVDHAFDIVGVYNNAKSPYYYTPFTEKVVDLFNQGNLFVVYVGHGSSSSTSGLTTSELETIHCQHRLPGAFFFACYNGAYVGPDDSVAEAMLEKPDGAIVVFASSDESHPYGNAVLLHELTRVLLGRRPATYGEGLRLVKRALVEHTDEFRELLDAFALLDVPPAEQPVVRAEHVKLYNLLGDPAASIGFPRSTVSFDPVVGGSFKDGKLAVSGRAPGVTQGTALVTLEVERDVLLHPVTAVDPYSPDQATVQANWSKAVDKVVTSRTVPVSQGAFTAELTWTPPLPGDAFYVKVYAESAAADSFGVVKVP